VIKWVQLLEVVPQTKFGRAKTLKIWRDFGQFSTLIANIFGTDRQDENLKTALSTTSPPPMGEKNGELWFTNKKVIGVNVDPPKWTFFNKLYFGR